MTAFLRALADRRGLAPEPDCRWPYEPPAVVDSFPAAPRSLLHQAGRTIRKQALERASRMRARRRPPCA